MRQSTVQRKLRFNAIFELLTQTNSRAKFILYRSRESLCEYQKSILNVLGNLNSWLIKIQIHFYQHSFFLLLLLTFS